MFFFLSLSIYEKCDVKKRKYADSNNAHNTHTRSEHNKRRFFDDRLEGDHEKDGGDDDWMMMMMMMRR